MAGRHLKKGLDYFSFDVDIEQDDKIKMLNAEHPDNGFRFYILLLCRIYRGHGYFIEYTERKHKLYCSDINVNINEGNDIINTCCQEGLFDKNLYKQNQILTSSSIQTRFLMASKRRENVQMVGNWTLLTGAEVKKANKKVSFLIYEDINSIFVDGNLIPEYMSLTKIQLPYKSFSFSFSISNNVFMNNRILNTVLELNRGNFQKIESDQQEEKKEDSFPSTEIETDAENEKIAAPRKIELLPDSNKPQFSPGKLNWALEKEKVLTNAEWVARTAQNYNIPETAMPGNLNEFFTYLENIDDKKAAPLMIKHFVSWYPKRENHKKAAAQSSKRAGSEKIRDLGSPKKFQKKAKW